MNNKNVLDYTPLSANNWTIEFNDSILKVDNQDSVIYDICQFE